jgi:hypothetical protein
MLLLGGSQTGANIINFAYCADARQISWSVCSLQV